MAGTYQFSTLDFPGVGASFQVISGINNAGVVIGYFGSGVPAGQNPSTSFLWSPLNGTGQFSAINNGTSFTQTRLHGIDNAIATPGGGSRVTVVGAGGLSTGSLGNASTTANLSGAASITGAATVASASIAAGGANPVLTGLNDLGTQVGFYAVSGAGTTAEIDAAATVRAGSTTFTRVTLTPASGQGTITSSQAYGVDNANDLVGTVTVSTGTGSVVEGFVLANGSPTVSLYAVPGATSTRILGVNNQGQLVGDFTAASGITYGFVQDIAGGAATTISAPFAGVVGTHIDGINDQGAVVGWYDQTQVVAGVTSIVSHGLIGALAGIPQTVVNPVANAVYGVVRGSGGVRVGGSNVTPVTLLDPGFGHVTLTGNAGSNTYNVFGAADTIVANAGVGANTINAAGSAGALIFLGAGANSVTAGLASTVVGGGGHDTVGANGAIVFAGQTATINGIAIRGSDTITVGAPAAGTSTTASTIIGGSGTTVVDGVASVGGTLFFGGSGINSVAGRGLSGAVTTGGAATLIGGSGTDYFVAGAGGGLIFAGTGRDVIGGNTIAVGGNSSRLGAIAATTIVAGFGNATINAYTGAVFLTDAKDQVVISGATSIGNLTLVGSQSTGNDVYVLGTGANGRDIVYQGSGRDTVLLGNGGNAQIVSGSGQDAYYVGATVASGAATIFGFDTGSDRVLLQSYDASSVATAINRQTIGAGGSTIVTINGVRIDFYGVGHVSSDVFAPG